MAKGMLYSRDDQLTVEQCYRRWWLPAAKDSLAESTLIQYESAWNGHIAPRWADVPACEVRPIDIQEWLLTLTRGAAEQSCKVLGRTLEYARLFEIINRNPMHFSYRMPSKAISRDKGIYTFEELLRRWDELRGKPIELPYLFSAFGSARVGEALGVRLDCPAELYFEQAANGMTVACVAIERQVGHNGEVIERLKTLGSRRTLVIPEPMSLRVRELVENARQKGRVWVISNTQGSTASQQAINRRWKSSFDGSDMPYHPFRNLRNSWRTFMSWEMGISDEKLEKMMGHSGGGVGMRYYNRPDVRLFVETVAQAFEGCVAN